MNEKIRSACMPPASNPSQKKRPTQTKSEGLEKNTPYKWTKK